MRVLIADPHRRADGEDIIQSAFERLLGESDYVVCLAAANADTENLMDERAFARMKNGTFS
jgi:D-3-phosphoglycerate dehydrogenase